MKMLKAHIIMLIIALFVTVGLSIKVVQDHAFEAKAKASAVQVLG